MRCEPGTVMPNADGAATVQPEVDLVLLPGMDGTGELFAPLIQALGQRFSLTVLRYPVDRPVGYDDLVSIVRAALPKDRPYVLLGESFSGPIAITLAAEAPAGLKGVVLCCSFARNPRPALAWLRPWVEMVPVKAMPTHALAWWLLGRAANDAWRSALSRVLAPVSPAVMRARLQAVLVVDVSTAWSQVNVPTLCLRASQDRVVPTPASRLLATLKPTAQVVELAGPHCLLQAAPHEAAQAIRAFAQSLPNDVPG